MKIQQFLHHHGLGSNPFAEEDAQTDPVFKEHCIVGTYHPSWDKVYGNPNDPATSIVFGEKGAGKTAMRLQIVRHLADHNESHPDQRIYVVEYDDFNPFLDRFTERLSLRNRHSARVLAQWKLWDHMDAILCLAVTGLVDRILEVKHPSGPEGIRIQADRVESLDRHQARDLLLLAACYDQSMAEPFKSRWHRLRKKLRFRTWRTLRDKVVGVLVTVLVLAVIGVTKEWAWLKSPWPYLIAAAGWVPWLVGAWKCFWQSRAVVRQIRVAHRDTHALRQVLMQFTRGEMNGQPLPTKERTDDRFELLMKLQGVLDSLGFSGIVVLVDRVDEPHLINGSEEQMRALVWPMLDNKFLKHPGLGIKLLLPAELSPYLDREQREFYQRARLDKQNLVPSLEWTGEALYDVATARVAACAEDGKVPALRDLFDDSVSEPRLLDALRTLRVPRHVFRYLYRLFVAHCNSHTDEHPSWKISSDTFESTLALYVRDQDAVDRGYRAG